MTHNDNTDMHRSLLQLLLFFAVPAALLVVILFLVWGTFTLPQSVSAATVTLVGTSTASGTNSAYNLSLTSLSAGIGSTADAGDLVIVVNTYTDTANGNPGVSTAGFTEMWDAYADDQNYDTNFSVSYKIMTATPDTTVSCNPSSNAASSSVCMASVWRGVDPNNPFDVASTSASGANADDVNCPSITPVTAGAVVVCTGGAAGASVDTVPTHPANTTALVILQVDAGGTAGAYGSYQRWNTGALDIAAYVIDLGTNTANSWAALTAALRPALGERRSLLLGTLILLSGTLILP